MNYYEHHIGDYDKSTSHLTACEDGIYCRLLRRYYDSEAPLPVDLSAVQRLVRARSKDEKKAVQAMLMEFFSLADDGWHQFRCDKDIEKFRDKSAKAKRSAESRWNPQCQRNANASETHVKRNALQAPDTKHHKEQEQGAPTKGRAKDVTLTAWIEALEGSDAIPADDTLFAWAKSVGLPREWIALAWWGFEARYAEDAKKYTDWRAVFRRAVREDWLKLWRVDRDGSYSLTTAGEQLRREMAS